MSGHVHEPIAPSLVDTLDRHRDDCTTCQHGGMCETAAALIEVMVDRMTAVPMCPRGSA